MCLKNGRTTKPEGKCKHDWKKAGVKEGVLVLSHFSWLARQVPVGTCFVSVSVAAI